MASAPGELESTGGIIYKDLGKFKGGGKISTAHL